MQSNGYCRSRASYLSQQSANSRRPYDNDDDDEDDSLAKPQSPPLGPVWGLPGQQPMMYPFMMNPYQFYSMMPAFGPQMMHPALLQQAAIAQNAFVQNAYAQNAFPQNPSAQNAFPSQSWPMCPGPYAQPPKDMDTSTPLAKSQISSPSATPAKLTVPTIIMNPVPPTPSAPSTPTTKAAGPVTPEDPSEDIPLAILAYRMGQPSEAESLSSSRSGLNRQTSVRSTASTPPLGLSRPSAPRRPTRPMSHPPVSYQEDPPSLGIVYESDEDRVFAAYNNPSQLRPEPSMPASKRRTQFQELRERECGRMPSVSFNKHGQHRPVPKVVLNEGNENETKHSFLSDSGYGSRSNSFESISRTGSAAGSVTSSAVSLDSYTSAATAATRTSTVSGRVGGWIKNKTRRLGGKLKEGR